MMLPLLLLPLPPPSLAAATAQQLLSAATTHNGSANSSPQFVAAAGAKPTITATVLKATAPKKQLITKRKKDAKVNAAAKYIKSRTIFPSNDPPFKPFKAPVVRDRDDAFAASARHHHTISDKADDDAIASALPTITQRKQDKYGNPWYRAWASEDKGGCPSEDRIVVLVHHMPRGDETEETRPPSEYMTFQQIKQHSLIKMKELPLPLRYGADLYFTEDAQLRANRLAAEAGGGTKRIQKKGAFAIIWRRTFADVAGYDRCVAKREAQRLEALDKRQWADW